MDSRTLWSLYQNVTAGAQSGVPFMDRIGRKINMMEQVLDILPRKLSRKITPTLPSTPCAYSGD